MKKIIPFAPVILALYGVLFICIGFFSTKLGTLEIPKSISFALRHSTQTNHKNIIMFLKMTIFQKGNFFKPDTFGLNANDKAFAIFAFTGVVLVAVGFLLFCCFIIVLLLHRSFIKTKEAVVNFSPAIITRRGVNLFNKKNAVDINNQKASNENNDTNANNRQAFEQENKHDRHEEGSKTQESKKGKFSFRFRKKIQDGGVKSEEDSKKKKFSFFSGRKRNDPLI